MNLIVHFLLAHTLSLGTPVVPKEVATQESQVATSKRDSIVDYAKTFLGTPYKYANAEPTCGFDCSGFTWFVFNHFGIALPRSSRDYINTGKAVSLDSCRKGDLILFTGTDSRDRTVGHVGIVISNPGDSVQFIHSSASKNHPGVTITNYYKSNYPKRFMGVRSVLP
jgi:cell wall-associated NlpC family hydrolase